MCRTLLYPICFHNCLFYHVSRTQSVAPRQVTPVHVEIRELQLDGSPSSEELTITPDINKGTQLFYSSPFPLSENIIRESFNIMENFTMHFSRCTTSDPGGKFKLAFTGNFIN